MGQVGGVLTEETGENLGCLLCLAWEGETLNEIARARGDEGGPLLGEGCCL